jgi:hypothetical protein
MRIAIHIDGDGANATGDPISVFDDSPAGRAPADAGAGPGADPGTGTTITAEADDTGGPPQWLLDAVGEAEASAADDQADPIDDAGAGPSA